MEIRIGKVTHYFSRLAVAVLELSGELKIGDVIHISGRNTDFTQPVSSMEIDHAQVDIAKPGTQLALKVAEAVHEGDKVYKIVEDLAGE